MEDLQPDFPSSLHLYLRYKATEISENRRSWVTRFINFFSTEVTKIWMSFITLMLWWKACKLASDHHLFKRLPLVLPKTYRLDRTPRSISVVTSKVDASQIFENMSVECQYLHSWLRCMTASTVKNFFYHCPSQAASGPTVTATGILLCTPRLTSQCRAELKVISLPQILDTNWL